MSTVATRDAGAFGICEKEQQFNNEIESSSEFKGDHSNEICEENHFSSRGNQHAYHFHFRNVCQLGISDKPARHQTSLH